MNRITPDDVLKAYAKTGLKPLRGLMFTSDHTCGCAIGALLLAADDYHDLGFGRKVSDRLGLDAGYTTGFTVGFDGTSCSGPLASTSEFQQGQLDGIACAAAVFGASP